METVLTASSVCVLLAIAILHIYWAFGGTWGSGAVLPQQAGGGDAVFMPPMLGTLFVAVAVLLAAFFLAAEGDLLPTYTTTFITKWGCILCAVVFFLRTIGDFRYFGVFKKVKDTVFAKNDTRFYTPLCLYLAIAFTIAL